jgi:type II secretory pathway component PulM
MKLTHRETWLVASFVAFIATWATFVFAIGPAVERIDTLNRTFPEKQNMLYKLIADSKQYLALQAKLQHIERNVLNDKGFELLTFIESTVKKKGLVEKVTTMRQNLLPLDSRFRQTDVEITLEGLAFEQLVDFLAELKPSNHPLWIQSLFVRKNSALPTLLDATIVISTFKPNEQNQY